MTENAAVLAEVVALEPRLLEPAVRASALEVGRLPHPDFREFGASGETWDRESVTRALAGTPGDPPVTSELAARLVADDVVLVTYTAGEGERASLRSSLWVRGQDGWRLIFHQGTPVGRGA